MSLNRKVFSNISKYPNGGGPVKKWGFLDSGKGKEEVVVGGGLNFPTGTGINAIGVIPKNQNQVFKGVGSLGITQQINPNFNLGVKFDKTFLDVGTKLPVFSNIQPSVTAKYTIPYKKKKYSGKLLKEGGEIKNLTDKEIQAYRDGGYVVEEYDEGGESGCPEGMVSDGKGGCVEITAVFNEQAEFEKTLPKSEPKYYDKAGNLLETVPDYGTIYVTGKDDPKYKEYQDRLKYYNKAKKLFQGDGLKEWHRELRQDQEHVDSMLSDPSVWSPYEIARAKKNLKWTKDNKDNYINYRSNYKGTNSNWNARPAGALPTIDWDNVKRVGGDDEFSSWNFGLGDDGVYSNGSDGKDQLTTPWSDILNDALTNSNVRPTKWKGQEGTMRPVFTYPQLNVKVLDESLVKEKSLSTPVAAKDSGYLVGTMLGNTQEPETPFLATKPVRKLERDPSFDAIEVNTTKALQKPREWNEMQVAPLPKVTPTPMRKSMYSEGGEVMELTNEQIAEYEKSGYVVEEYHKGGAVHNKSPHPHPPYDRYLDNSNVAVSDNTQPHNYYPAPKIPKVTPPNFVTDKAFPITSNTRKYPKSTLIEKDNSKIKRFVDENKRYLGQVYGDDLYNEDGSYNYKKLASANDLGEIVEDAKYAEFSKNEQEAYDAAPFYEKAANAVTATIADPMLTIRNAIFEGKGPMMGQWKGLNDEGNENERFYKNATGYDDDWLNSGFNFINPLAYTGEAVLADNAFDAGLNLTDALTMGSVSGLIKPLTSYKKFSKSRALKAKAKKRATALDKKIDLIEWKKIMETNDALELEIKAIAKRSELEKEINKQAGAYYKKAKSPENMKRAAAHDAEHGTEYVKSLNALQADKIGYMNSFNIKIKPNPKDGTAGFSTPSKEAIQHNKMVEYAKNSKTLDQKFAPKELRNGIKDREIIVYDDMELSDVKRVINHELKHHWTMPNEAKNYDNLILEGGLESPAEISKFNPQLADDLIQPAFPLKKAENQSAYEYFSSGREVDAYVNTNLRDELVDAGILKNHWDDLDDTKLATYLMGKPSKHSKRYIDMAGKDFVKNFNKGVYVVAPVVGLGLGANEALKNKTKGKSYKFDDGGKVMELTKAEIEKYRDGGYIVEEY